MAKDNFKFSAEYEAQAKAKYLEDLKFAGYVKRSFIMRFIHKVVYNLFPNWYIYYFGCNWQWTK